MRLHEIIEKSSKTLENVDFRSLSSTEKYAFTYCEAALRFFNFYVGTRKKQYLLAKAISEQKATQAEVVTQMNLERDSFVFIEQIYTYIHRLEVGLRKNYFSINVDRFESQKKKKEWMNNLSFLTLIRNNFFEHAAEEERNLKFFSDWGTPFNLNDIYDFRIWILNENAIDLLHSENDYSKELNEKLNIIENHMDLDKSQWFSKLLNINEGARYLDWKSQKALYDKSLRFIGIITHNPTELASTLHNLIYMKYN